MFERTVSFWRRVMRGPQTSSTKDLATVDERRVWVRYPSGAEVVCKATSDNAGRCAAQVRDVSRGGISFRVGRPFEPGNLLNVELPAGPTGTTNSVLACVVHVAALPNKEWAVGCNFASELEEGELRAFGAGLRNVGEASDAAPQQPGQTLVATYQVVTEPGVEPSPAKVLDLSPTSLSLQVERMIENGTLLSVELFRPHAATPLSVLACVVHVSLRPVGGPVLGCNFITELDEGTFKTLR